jgi:hypothetical protein
MVSASGFAPRPLNKEVDVRWWYIGAHTRHTDENRETCAVAAPTSAGWTVRFALADFSELTVGYT